MLSFGSSLLNKEPCQLFHRQTIGLTQENKFRHMQLMDMDVWDTALPPNSVT